MNSEEKIDKLYNDMTEVKVTLARLESCLHPAPCSHLCEHVTKHSGDIADLHNQHKVHIEAHHSSKNVRANWAALAAVVCALATIASVILKQ